MRSLRIISCIGFVCCLCYGAFAQSEEEIPTRDSSVFSPPKIALKYSPTSLYTGMVPAMQFALEHTIGGRNSMQYELGAILPYNLSFDLGIRGQGIRLRTEYRRYFKSSDPMFPYPFIGGQYFFQQEHWDMFGWVPVQDGNYEKYLNYEKDVVSHGALFVIGAGFWGKKRKAFWFEGAMALGLRYRNATNSGLPDDVDTLPEPLLPVWFSAEEQEPDSHLFVPTMQFTIKVGIGLK